MANQFDEEDEAEEKILSELEKVSFKNKGKAENAMTLTKKPNNRTKNKIAAKLSSNVRRWNGWHARLFERSCDVCMLLPEARDEVHQQYIRGVSFVAIKKATGCAIKWLRAHANAEAWDWEKAKETDRVLALLQERGIEYVTNNADAVDGELLLKTTQWIDKRENRIVDRVQNETNVAIQFVNMPPPITPAKNALPEITAGKKPLTLAPSSIEVVDAEDCEAETVQANEYVDDVPPDKRE